MGCEVDAGVCPAVFSKDVEDWGLPDPKGRPVDGVRRRVKALPEGLARQPV